MCGTGSSRRSGTGVPPEQAEYLRVIDRNADRLLDLINDLLDVAQAATGQQTVIWC
jgi:signal transduction histidine kinase